jgi:hypothetical protein
MRGAALARIIERHCGKPLSQRGSHRKYQGLKIVFIFAFHDRAEVNGDKVRRVLIEDVGLSASEAREEVG